MNSDILIVGGGMAGFSLAASLAGRLQGGEGVRPRIILIEQENAPAYHATGRSVAFWTESYGGPGIQPLTSASGPLLARPDPDFSTETFLSPRGAIHVGRAEDAARAASMQADFAQSGIVLQPLDRASLAGVIPGLRPEWTIGLAEPSCRDIDVAALLAAYRRAALRGGVDVRLSTRFLGADRDGEGWQVRTDGGAMSCGVLVNAAGAWADRVAQACGVAPLGIRPLRRTVAQVRAEAVSPAMPLVIDLAERFYFKPAGAGRLWLSPHDEAADSARDVAPEEIDIALAMARLQSVVDWPLVAVEHKWAGLRSFAPDRLPVYGYDGRVPGFFWFAGQGGFGIQTAPAAALLGAALLLGEALPAPVAGIDPHAYAPGRF